MAEQTNLPSIPPPNENNLVAFARAVKEALEVRLGRRGQGLDAMVTFRDLDKVQMVQGDGRGGVVGLRPPAAIGTVGGGYDPTLDTTPPSAPQNVKASGAVRNIILEWDGPPSTYRNHAYAEVWRSSTNNLNDAAQIGQSGSTMYVDNVGEGQARYYWVRFVSQANVTGPWHAAGDAGVQAATAIDVGYTLGLLEGQIGEDALATETINGKDAFVFDTKTFAIRFNETGYTPFVVQSTPTTINGVEIPAGVYLDAAFMRTFVAQAGQIGALAVDDAAIANLSAAKLTAGDGTIGGILKSANYVSGVSGWAVHPSGWAEFANATVRGTIYADTGWFKGQIIGGAATTYTSGAGMWTGVDAGTWKFRLGSSGTYLRWDGASLTLRGTLTIEDGSGNVLLSSGTGIPWTQINSRPTSLSGLNANEGSKLAGIASGADVTSQNTAKNIAGQGAFATLSKITPSNVSTYIDNAAIGNAQIGNIIQSNNYVPNSSGWYINKSGFCEFQNGLFRGTIKGSIIDGATIISTNQLQPTDAGAPYYTSLFNQVATRTADFVKSGYAGREHRATTAAIGFYAYNQGPANTSTYARYKNYTITLTLDVSHSSPVVGNETEYLIVQLVRKDTGAAIRTLVERRISTGVNTVVSGLTVQYGLWVALRITGSFTHNHDQAYDLGLYVYYNTGQSSGYDSGSGSASITGKTL